MLDETQLRAEWATYLCKGPYTKVTFAAAGPYDGSVALNVAADAAPVMAAVAGVMLRHGYTFDETAGGTYNCRKIKGTDKWSLHAYAIALDVNPSRNPRTGAGGAVKTDMPAAMVTELEALRTVDGQQAVTWGGRWNNPDPMHWQIACTRAGARQGVAMTFEEQHGTDVPGIQASHDVGTPEWAKPLWDKYVAAGGSSVPTSSGWPAFRYDLAWFHQKWVAPLQAQLAALTKRVEELESTGGGGGLGYGDTVKLTQP